MENVVGAASPNPLAQDLDHILEHTSGLWDDLRGQRVFVTGGTGFFGCWLLESLLWANDRLGLDVSVAVLTRDEAGFRKKAAHLADHPRVTLHRGDVREFEFPRGDFSHVIHAATASGSNLSTADPLQMFDTIVTGTRRTLEFARSCGARRFLLTSSGAVYGRQPPDISHLDEDYRGGPDQLDTRSVYSEGKRAAEMLCTLYADRYGIEPTIARCFAFIGPYLPIDAHFAAGNFIRDALAGGPVHVTGDGSPLRSYLYSGDLAIWLWTILLRGQALHPYNVGSPRALSIAELADVVARTVAPAVSVKRAQLPSAGVPAERYVPSVTRAEKELGLQARISVEEAIRRTVSWHEHRKSPVGADN